MRSKNKKSSGTGANAQNKARKTYDEAVFRAFRAYREIKEQSDVTYKKALEQAIDEQVKKEADLKYREILERARKVRDQAMDEAQKAFSDAMSK